MGCGSSEAVHPTTNAIYGSKCVTVDTLSP